MTENEKNELIRYRIERSKSTLEEVDVLISNKLWFTSVNRLYYACYYAVIALLIKHNISASTHAGARQLFGLHFVKTGKISKESGRFYSEIFNKRMSGDYDDMVEYTEADVFELVAPARELINAVESLL